VEDLVHTLDTDDITCRLDFQRATEPAESLESLQPKRLIGYQRSGREQALWPPVGKTGPGWQPPKPLPKRPTGRFFVGGMLACFCLGIAWHVWNTFFSVAAYGVVKGDTLPITATCDGKVEQLAIREGQSIAEGDLLITLVSTQLVRKLERLHDDLTIEKAKLDAESLRLRWEGQTNTAQYFQMWGTLEKNREDLHCMQRELEQIKAAGISVVSQKTLQRLEHAEAGQREFVAKISSALDALRLRGEPEEQTSESESQTQLRPIRARIIALDAEIQRTRAEIREGEIHSPIAGVVAKCQTVVGQYVAANDPLLEIVGNDSRRIELFVPQAEVGRYPEGKQIRLTIHPRNTPVTCVVVGSRQRFEPAPESIQYFYSNRDTLMPVILAPCEGEATNQLFFGAVTKYTLFESLCGR